MKKLIEKLRGRKAQETEQEVEAEQVDTCESKMDNIAMQVAGEYHQDRIHFAIMQQAMTSTEPVFVNNYKTTFNDEKGFVSEHKNPAFPVETSAETVDKIKKAFFNHTCAKCQSKDPSKDCLANRPPVGAIMKEAVDNRV